MDLAAIFEIITAAAVILGILFGLLQLRHYHLSRKREADLFLLNSFQTGEFLQGLWIIQELPNGLTKNEIEDRVGKEMRSVYLVMSTWERIGILVFKHEISIAMVDDAYSGPIIISWQRLEKYVTDLRKDLARERPLEWFQWLAERMMDREQTQPPVPAYLAYRNWN
jgi:hypothetical protein